MMVGTNTPVLETIKRIPTGSVGVELGVWKGESASLFLTKASKLYLVDAWSVSPYVDGEEWGSYQAYLDRYSKVVGGRTEEDFKRYYEKIYTLVKDKFKDDRRVFIYRGTTTSFFAFFDKKVDWVYVDASHSYTGCINDLYGSLRVATTSIYGDDYGNKEGVTKAVDQFIKETNLPFNNFYKNQYEITVDASV